MRNQTDIGNAIKPYYGRAAGNRLTTLFKEHITGAVALLQAAKAGDQDLIERRTAEWHANGNQIADLLHEANPRNWSRKAMRRMMRRHLDQTVRKPSTGSRATMPRTFATTTGSITTYS